MSDLLPANRLEIELEFVQCLANPYYLNYLANTKVLEDERFINYLFYLEYFRRPEYAKLLTYPVYSLSALDLLKQPQFRIDIMNPALALELVRDMIASFVLPEQEYPSRKEDSSAPAMIADADAARQTNGIQSLPQRNGT